jgi:RNA polymerase sigma factor (sigma-70 family)
METEDLIPLLKRWLDRDKAAGSELVTRLAPGLLRRLRSKLPTQQDAEDLLQETLMAILLESSDKRAALTSDAALLRLIWVVAQNKVHAFFRKRYGREAHQATIRQLAILRQELANEEADLWGTVHQRQELLDLFERSLDCNEAAIFRKMRTGTSVNKIATELGLSESNVRPKRRQILKRLKVFLARYDDHR